MALAHNTLQGMTQKLYVIGDSNAVYTCMYLMAPVDTSLCKEGWTTDDVLNALGRKKNLADATSFFIFVGLNDRVTGEHMATNISRIVHGVRQRGVSDRVPVLLVPPFCVSKAVSTDLFCDDRRRAAVQLMSELRDIVVVVSPHVTRDMYVKKQMQTIKRRSMMLDPLHINAHGYMTVATVVNQYLAMHAFAPRRSSKYLAR